MPGELHVLDAELLFLLSLLRPVFAGLAAEHRQQARLWLQRLCQSPARSDSARKDRNEYLCRLYHCAMKNRLDAVFLDEPPEGALRPAQQVFPALDTAAWLRAAASAGSAAEAKAEAGGGDERTYLATQVLPEGRGAFGYLAVSLAEGEPHWLSRRQSHSTSGWRAGEPQAASTPLPPEHADGRQTAAPSAPVSPVTPAGAAVWPPSPGLADQDSRPPAEQRQRLIDFYDSLVRDLDQAVMEPDRSSLEVEKLLSSLQGSSAEPEDGGDVSARQKELLARLRERLCARRERALERSLLLDSLELDDQIEEATQPRAGTPSQPHCDVSAIKEDNVALLQAAYPRQLVDRFLDAVVRERVAVMGRVRARRYCLHVDGLEDDAAEDVEHYRDATAAWAGVLSAASTTHTSSDGGSNPVAHAAKLAKGCAEAATEAAAGIRELGEARRRYFEKQDELCNAQDRMAAEIEVLRAEDAALRRRLHQALDDDGGASSK